MLFSLLIGKGALWSDSGPIILPSGTYGFIFGLLLLAISFLLHYSTARESRVKLTIEPFGASIGVVFLFLSDWLCRSYNLFQAPIIRGEIILALLIVVTLLPKRKALQYFIALLLALALLWISFFTTAAGRMLVSDDHATFVFRLMSLKENFPFIPYYSPVWNAGFDARDFFATGALNVFLLFAPLIYLFDVSHIYNLIIASIIFGLLPLSVFIGARICRLTAPAPAMAAIIAMGSSLMWYRWGLKYGTVGFITSAALSPLVLALLTKFLSKEEQLSRIEALLLVVTTSLMLCWSPSTFVILPAGIYGLVYLGRVLHKQHSALIIGGIFALTAPWVVVFLSVSKVTTFVKQEQPSYQATAEGTFSTDKPTPIVHKAKPSKVTVQNCLRVIRDFSTGANPLIIFLALPGILLLAGAARPIFGLTSVSLAALGSIIALRLPQLELDRMLVILGVILSIPAAAALAHMTRATEGRVFSRLSTALCLAFLLVTPFSAAGVVSNNSIEQYFFASPLFTNLTQAIKKYGGNGRVLFSGFILHQVSDGHIAPLAELTGKPLMASSPFHNLWSYRQIFPKSFIERKESAGIEEYLDLYNVSAVLAHERSWLHYFSSKPEKYQPAWHQDKFTLFVRTTSPASYYIQGSGQEPEVRSNSIVLKPTTSEVVLRFNYFPFLKSSSCIISGQQVALEVSFIKLSQCTPGSEVIISSVGALSRIGL